MDGAGHGPAEGKEEQDTLHCLVSVETVDAGRAIRQTEFSHDSYLSCELVVRPGLEVAASFRAVFVLLFR